MLSHQKPFNGALCSDFIFDDESFQPLDMPTHASKLRDLLSRQHLTATMPLPQVLRSSAFMEVISALLLAHQHHQMKTVNNTVKHNDRLSFELSTLPDVPGTQLMYLDGRDGDITKVKQVRILQFIHQGKKVG
jgi:hypothetical protein